MLPFFAVVLFYRSDRSWAAILAVVTGFGDDGADISEIARPGRPAAAGMATGSTST